MKEYDGFLPHNMQHLQRKSCCCGVLRKKKLLQPLVAIDQILATFDRRDLKELQHVLGIEVKRDREAITLSISHK